MKAAKDSRPSLLVCQSLDPEYKTTAFFQMHFQEKNIVLYSGQYSTN